MRQIGTERESFLLCEALFLIRSCSLRLVRSFLTVVVFVHSGGTLHQQFGAHPSVRHTTPHHMAAKKKGDATTTSTDMTTTMTPPQDEATPGQEPATGNEDITVEDIAEGQHEVDLLDLGISAKTSLQCEGLMLASKRREEPRDKFFRKKLRSLKLSRGRRGRK